MYLISNSHLSVEIIDPLADQAHCGSRYCTGGYIWQMYDSEKNPLFSGPRYPSATPPPYDGQGAPESFVTPLGDDPGTVGEVVTIIGVGRVVRSVDTLPFNARFNPTVQEFCTWEVELNEHALCMTTSQTSGDYGCTLERRVKLEGRTVVSSTKMVNTALQEMPLRWFPHPFFPLSGDYRCCRLGGGWTVPENDGYALDDEGIVHMKRVYDWNKGLFLKLGGQGSGCFSAGVFHPSLKSIAVKTNYLATELPIWANSATFSPEPYLVMALAAGETASWQVEYAIHQKS